MIISFIKNPEWLAEYEFAYTSAAAIPSAVFAHINALLDQLQQDKPVVSIIISAWNEEVTILKTIASLAGTLTAYPLEIIVVNNNSTDDTQATLSKLHVKSFFQPIQGWGPARQMGLEQAKGIYVLTADADCIYPSHWVDHMIAALKVPGVVCVYGRYSFIAEPGLPRWKLALLERMKDTIAAIRDFKRPFLNAYGMSMGFLREEALKTGFVMHKVRGEDGRLCYDLMQAGKVVPVKVSAARVWTGPRTLRQDGTFGKALAMRIIKELRRVGSLMTSLPAHDTKISTND